MQQQMKQCKNVLYLLQACKKGNRATWYSLFRLVFMVLNIDYDLHCVKSVRIWSYSAPYFPAFGLNTERYSVPE